MSFILLKTNAVGWIGLKKNVFSFLLVLAMLFGVGFAKGQAPISIQTIHEKIDQATEYVYSANPEKAIPILEEAKEDSESIGYRFGIAKVGYTLAIVYFNSSDYNKVINLDEAFLRVGNEAKDYENVSHIHRLKGGAYSELGLLSQGREEYNQALKYAQQMAAGNSKQYALSLIYSNLSSHLLKSDAPREEIFASIDQCIAAAEGIEETDSANVSKKYRMIAYAYIIMANEYDKAGEFDQAEAFYLKSLDIHSSNSVPLVERVVLFNQLAHFYYGTKEFDQSIKYAEEGLSIEKTASIPQLRKELFEVLSKSYMELDEIEQSKKYIRLFTALNDSLLTNNRKTIDAALNKTISSQNELRINNDHKQLVIYGLIGIVLVIFATSFYLYRKKQQQIQRIKQVVEQLKAKQENPAVSLSIAKKVSVSKEKEEKHSLMSAETEERLLEKLKAFENKQLFLERKVSLPYVAAEIETNTKYLSYLIKKHKEKDFNEYINELRISYIVQKINDDPVYRKYKINALAEEAGFSSHSKFTTVFKGIIGVSPSEFVKYFQKK